MVSMLTKNLIIPQRFHRPAHCLHPRHQDGESQHDIAHIPIDRSLAEHPQHDTHNRHDG